MSRDVGMEMPKSHRIRCSFGMQHPERQGQWQGTKLYFHNPISTSFCFYNTIECNCYTSRME